MNNVHNFSNWKLHAFDTNGKKLSLGKKGDSVFYQPKARWWKAYFKNKFAVNNKVYVDIQSSTPDNTDPR